MQVRRTYKKSESSRKQVLDAAIRVLSEQGYAKTSVSEIAKAAGMSKGAVHYHFESKEDLIAHVLEACARNMRERVHAVWDAPGESTEKIRRALRAMRIERRHATPELRVLSDLMAQGIYDPKLRKALSKLFEANREEVLRHLEESFQRLGLKPRVPLPLVPRIVLGLLDGLALHDFFDRPTAEEEAELQQALETIALSLVEA